MRTRERNVGERDEESEREREVKFGEKLNVRME